MNEVGSLSPKISVITVVFNRVEFIETAILSVRDQDYGNIEYIVIDGGSTDGTLEVIEKYEDIIDYWASEADRGMYDAINKGMAVATGEFVGMLNSDDFYTSNDVLTKVVRRFLDADVDAVFSNMNIVDRYESSRILRHYSGKNFSTFKLRMGIVPPHPTFYCKKSVYDRVGLHSTDYRVVADYEIMVRIFYRLKISYSFIEDLVMVTMRAGGLSNNGIVGQIQHNFEIVRAAKANGLYTNIFLVVLKIPFRLLEFFKRV